METLNIWFTINSPSPFHLRELVLRMYWDGEKEPSVEVPIGDFFGTGFEYEDVPGGHRGPRYESWWSLPITLQDRAMNCYFEMPFGKGGRVTLSNDGKQDVPNLYFHIDYQEYRDARPVANNWISCGESKRFYETNSEEEVGSFLYFVHCKSGRQLAVVIWVH